MEDERPVIPRIGSLRKTQPTKEEIEQAKKKYDDFLAAEAKILEQHNDLYKELADLLK